MAINSLALDLKSPALLNTREKLICEVQRGLSKRPLSLAPWVFYDACGPRLFDILRSLGAELRAGDALLLGTDLVKDVPALVAAYDDEDNVTAAFNLNIRARLNRELGADFYTADFRHCVVRNPSESRIEMHLDSRRDQRVQAGDAKFDPSLEQDPKRFIPRAATNSRSRALPCFSNKVVLRSSEAGPISGVGTPLRWLRGDNDRAAD